MPKPFKKKKLPKYPAGGFLDKTKDLGLYAADNALTTLSGGLGANLIKQDQYDNTGFGRELGKNQAYKESFDAMSPLAKIGTKTGIVKHDQESTGMSDVQQANYDQAKPFAQMGSKIGEMWAGQGLAGITGKPKTDAAGNSIPGSGQSLGVDKMAGMAMEGNYVAQSPTVQPNQAGTQFQATGSSNYYNPNDPNNPQLVGQGKFPMGGLNMLPNAEVEKQENTIAPNGDFTQFNGPSHEQGGIPTNLDQGERIFSDRLKLGKKTFAALNKPNNTNKEDKILEESKSDITSKKSALLMKDVKLKASDKLFQIQEELKRSKVLNYAKRMGLSLGNTQHAMGGYNLYPDGGTIPPVYNPNYNQGRIPDSGGVGTNASGMPIDKYGRTLTAGQQLGFNRSITQGNTFTNTGGGFSSPGVGMMGLGNVGGVPSTGVDPYGRPLTTQGQYVQQPLNQTTDQFIAQYAPKKFGSGGTNDPWRNKNMTDEEYNSANTPSQSTNNFDWKGALFNAGVVGANSMGQLGYLAEQGKKYDKQDFYEYKPERLDPTASLRDLDIAAKSAAYDLADRSSGNAGNYLANRIQLAGMTSLNKDKIRREYANQNAQIGNQGQELNIRNKYMTDDINARNKGAALSNYYNTAGSIGTNVAQGGRDYKADQIDNMSLAQMKDMFSNYSYDKSSNSWKFKK